MQHLNSGQMLEKLDRYVRRASYAAGAEGVLVWICFQQRNELWQIICGDAGSYHGHEWEFSHQ